MSNVALTLPESVVNRVMASTGKRTARAAVMAALAERGNVPNAETVRALRSKRPGVVMRSRDEFKKFVDSL
ncbi:MAG: hypothetical protein ACRETW_15040 [Stenotrophobium sp.]